MKRIILSLGLLGLSTSICIAQKIKDYRAANGVTYSIGDTVRLGRGSANNGDFLYLQMGGWAALASYNSSKNADQFNIGRGYANTAVIVKKIAKTKIKGIEKAVFTVGGGNITNYLLSIDDAVQACEVLPCSDLSKTNNSVADELTKLKKLLDDGAITQAEYDAQKKKLLN